MRTSREYPERPIVGVGGVVIHDGRALLIRRGSEPLLGQWSIPGGSLEVGETLEQGVVRELLEETGVEVRVAVLIEVFERIDATAPTRNVDGQERPRYHYVIVDYLCDRVRGEPRAGGDATDVAYAREEELGSFQLTETAQRILRKAFAIERERKQTV
jgi:ADP-ribose pyrophosphatase YjhB (NUDIX family)